MTIPLFILLAVTASCYGIQELPYTHADDTFDQELYESVLDYELCERQLQYIREEDLSLRLKFLDSGLRLPRNILKGGILDFGNYPQCLSIKEEVEDMVIQGKHCMVHVPLNFFSLEGYNEINRTSFIAEFEEKKSFLLAREGMRVEPSNRMIQTSFMLGICIPQACHVYDALRDTIFNIGGNMYDRVYPLACRLPDDKPFVAADYVAWVIFSLLGLITIVSTIYDVRHTFILKKDRKKANELYSAFSVYKNSCTLLNMTSRPGTVECLDGIRALSVMWVMVGHSFMMGLLSPANPLNMFEWHISTKAIWMKTSLLAVDTFFLLSGVLVIYTAVPKFSPMKLLKNLHMFYLHRYLRMLPVLAVVILFISSIQHHTGDGPQWHNAAHVVQACRTYWWLPLLHLQNFLKPVGGCLPETWYLAIDFQLHLLSPIVLIWLFGGKIRALVAVISAFCASFTASAIYVFLTDFYEEDKNHDSHFYKNILTRAPPFFVGMICGYMLHTTRHKKCGLPKVVGYVITASSLVLAGVVLYYAHIHIERNITLTEENVLLSVEKTLWAICVGWIIFACVNGYAGPINWFLSLSVWKIPSRISYSMYLIHMTVIMLSHHASTLTPVYFTVQLFGLSYEQDSNFKWQATNCFLASMERTRLGMGIEIREVGPQLFDYLAFLYLTLFVSFFLTAMIDLPFATLSRILLTGGMKTQEKPISNLESGVKVEEN